MKTLSKILSFAVLALSIWGAPQKCIYYKNQDLNIAPLKTYEKPNKECTIFPDPPRTIPSNSLENLSQEEQSIYLLPDYNIFKYIDEKADH